MPFIICMLRSRKIKSGNAFIGYDFRRSIASIPLDYAGYAIVGLFVVSWLVAIAVWRYGHIEEKWSAHLITTPRVDA